MREITTHRIEGKGGGKDTTGILVLDEPGQGACHKYVVVADTAAAEVPGSEFLEGVLCSVAFQNGPIQEVGVNGVQQEHLLAVVDDRLEAFQAGPFANDYNAKASYHVKEALRWLHRRTLDRIARDVEGYNKA